MADFIFRVESVTLTEEQKHKIATAIQGAILTELAAIDLAPRGTGSHATSHAAHASSFAFFPHQGWYGGILSPEIATLEKAANTVLTVQTGEAFQTATAKKS